MRSSPSSGAYQSDVAECSRRVVDVVIGRFEPLVAHGLAGVLGAHVGVRVVARDVDHRQIAVFEPREWPCVAIVDEQVSRAVLPWRRLGGMELIVLADAPQRADGMRLLAAGASCVARNAALAEITAAVYLAANGGRLFVSARGERIERRYPAWGPVLTEREADVLRCFSAGCSYRDVADVLRISMSTVRTYAESLRQKFCVPRTRDLIGMPVPSDPYASEIL